MLSFCTYEKVTNVQVQIQIESPQQNAEVTLTEIVKGKVSDPKMPIYVLVHPMSTNLWWVQNLPAPPNQDGSWQTLCYFGTENEGIGEYFEVVAIATGRTSRRLRAGQTLEELPKDVTRSDIVTVRRIR